MGSFILYNLNMDLIPNILGGLSFSSRALADISFFAMALFAAVMSAILFFHWRKYGMGGATLALTELVYLAVSVSLLAIAFFALN
jgi:hypothetical protein